ncbi:MAG: FAD:protein FMN transferase, partial [Flavobacteriales bacterium]|nr:FAD:protein FMN transferase [Flavobacteriales bacterium]
MIWAILSLAVVSCGESKKDLPLMRKITGQCGPYAFEVVYGGDTTDFQHQIDSIFALVDITFNPNKAESVVARYNAFSRTDTMFCFDDHAYLFGSVYDIYKDVYRKTRGYLDPTVGPLESAWATSGSVAPDLDSLYAFIGFDEGLIDMIEKTDTAGQYVETQLRKADPRIRLNFGKFPYAYALDMVGGFLLEQDITDFRLILDDVVLCHGFSADAITAFPITLENDSVRVINSGAAFRDLDDKMKMMDPAYGYPVSADEENT